MIWADVNELDDGMRASVLWWDFDHWPPQRRVVVRGRISAPFSEHGSVVPTLRMPDGSVQTFPPHARVIMQPPD